MTRHFVVFTRGATATAAVESVRCGDSVIVPTGVTGPVEGQR